MREGLESLTVGRGLDYEAKHSYVVTQYHHSLEDLGSDLNNHMEIAL